jgi:hypothetical protein
MGGLHACSSTVGEQRHRASCLGTDLECCAGGGQDAARRPDVRGDGRDCSGDPVACGACVAVGGKQGIDAVAGGRPEGMGDVEGFGEAASMICICGDKSPAMSSSSWNMRDMAATLLSDAKPSHRPAIFAMEDQEKTSSKSTIHQRISHLNGDRIVVTANGVAGVAQVHGTLKCHQRCRASSRSHGPGPEAEAGRSARRAAGTFAKA